MQSTAAIHTAQKHRQGVIRTALEATVWGIMMASSAAVSLLLGQGRDLDTRTAQIMAIYFAGAFIAFAVARPCIRIVHRQVSGRGRVLSTMLILTVVTFGATAVLLALDYRAYYAEWHDNFPSLKWFFQQAFTFLGSTYQYLVIGTRLYLPLGPMFLLLATWWINRRAS